MADADAAQRTREQVQDAYELAHNVVENGVTDEQGNPLSTADIAVIESTAGMLGIINVSSDTAAAAQPTLPDTKWNEFAQAYYRLAIATSPVTAETLRNTRFVAGTSGAAERSGQGWWGALYEFFCGYSAAQSFTRSLWLITVIVVVLVMVTEWRIDALGMNPDVDKVKVSKDLWEWVQPWAYGALGACAYLLRQGHYYIRTRSFDQHRKPEYFNRIMLGAVSGGAIILFADYIFAQSDTPAYIGPPRWASSPVTAPTFCLTRWSASSRLFFRKWWCRPCRATKRRNRRRRRTRPSLMETVAAIVPRTREKMMGHRPPTAGG